MVRAARMNRNRQTRQRIYLVRSSFTLHPKQNGGEHPRRRWTRVLRPARFPLSVLYHTFKKNAIPFIEKNISFCLRDFHPIIVYAQTRDLIRESVTWKIFSFVALSIEQFIGDDFLSICTSDLFVNVFGVLHFLCSSVRLFYQSLIP